MQSDLFCFQSAVDVLSCWATSSQILLNDSIGLVIMYRFIHHHSFACDDEAPFDCIFWLSDSSPDSGTSLWRLLYSWHKTITPTECARHN